MPDRTPNTAPPDWAEKIAGGVDYEGGMGGIAESIRDGVYEHFEAILNDYTRDFCHYEWQAHQLSSYVKRHPTSVPDSILRIAAAKAE